MKNVQLKPIPDAIGQILADGRIIGDNLPELTRESIKVLRVSKATAHKIKGMIVCVAPMANDAVLLHCYTKLPKGTRLSDVVGLVKEAAENVPAHKAPSMPQADVIASAIDTVLTLKPKHQAMHFLHKLRDAGIKSVLALSLVTNSEVGKVMFQNSDHSHIQDALTRSIRLALKDETNELDQELLANKLGGKILEFILPDNRDKGIALVLLDATTGEKELLKSRLSYLGALNPQTPSTAVQKSRLWRYGIMSSLVIAAVYLLWPAPIYVNNFATTRPSASQVIALPFGAFLEQVNIRSGQMAEPGQTLVTLRAPQIEDALAEQSIQRQLEEITAQEALEAGNIAEFQLAEKRKEIAEIRETQLNERAAILNVVATSNSRVITVQSQSDKGMFLSEGTSVVTLQDDFTHDIIIDVKHEDAARLMIAQKGRVTFRGLTTRTHTFTLRSTPVQIEDPNGQVPRLQVVGRISSRDQSDLISGLDGFARIETGYAARIVGLTRPFREYIRVKLWTYLGITF